MTKKQKTTKKLFFGTDQCLITAGANENFMGANYGLWSTPEFKLYENRDDALCAAMFDFIERGEFILHGHGCWNFDRALYEALWAGNSLKTYSENDAKVEFLLAKEAWRANEIELAKKITRGRRRGASGKQQKAFNGFFVELRP